jgi:hypothetical protein
VKIAQRRENGRSKKICIQKQLQRFTGFSRHPSSFLSSPSLGDLSLSASFPCRGQLVCNISGPLKNFWRVWGIAYLLEYPEKTDRLEQRQAAGKTLDRPFFCAVKCIPDAQFSALN